jgi:hypothetical protein
MIPDLTDIPKWKDWEQTSMSKHFRVFEMYLSQNFGAEGFPLDWVVRLTLPAYCWMTFKTACAKQGKEARLFQV